MIEKRKFTIRITRPEVFAAIKAHFPYVVSVQAIPANAYLVVGADGLDISWEKDIVSVHRTDGGPGNSPTGGTPVASAVEEMAEGFSFARAAA